MAFEIFGGPRGSTLVFASLYPRTPAQPTIIATPTAASRAGFLRGRLLAITLHVLTAGPLHWRLGLRLGGSGLCNLLIGIWRLLGIWHRLRLGLDRRLIWHLLRLGLGRRLLTSRFLLGDGLRWLRFLLPRVLQRIAMSHEINKILTHIRASPSSERFSIIARMGMLQTLLRRG